MHASLKKQARTELFVERLEARRLLAGVAVDPSFAGPSGRAVIDTATAADLRSESAATLLRQPDGKLIVAGTTRGSVGSAGLIVRLNADGTPDPTFAVGGVDFLRYDADTTLTVARLLPDGKLVVAGNSATTGAFLSRLNADGSIDPRFGTSGRVRLTGNVNMVLQDLIVLPDGKLFVSGTAYPSAAAAVVRFTSNGTLDTAFGVGGMVAVNQETSSQGVSQLVQLSPTKVMGITPYGQLTLIDPVAGTMSAPITTANAYVAGVVPSRLLALPDGRVAAIGAYVKPGDAYRQPVFARFNGDGTIDPTFGTDGYTALASYSSSVTAGAAAFVRQADGTYVVLMSITPIGVPTSLDLLHFSADGALDTGFSGRGKFTDVLRDFPAGTYRSTLATTNALLDPQGRLVTTATSRYGPPADGWNSTDNVIVSRYTLDLGLTPQITLPATATPQGNTVAASALGTTAAGLPVLRYEWDQDYTPDAAFDVDATGQDVVLKALRWPTQTVGLRVVTSDGAGAIFTAPLAVTNVAPTIAAGLAVNGTVYRALPLAFTVADPGIDTFTLKVTANGTTTTYANWTPATAVTVNYRVPGDYTAVVTVTDAGGLSATTTVPVHVTPLTGRVVDAQSPATGFAGTVVFLDTNRNGTLDSTETSFTTAADGTYVLPTLPAQGTYQLGVVAPAGYSLYNAATELRFTLSPFTNTWTGGMIKLTRSAAVSGALYDDQNGDGLPDASNTPVVGATVWADLNGNAAIDAGEPSAVTGTAGQYTLELGDAGTYTVRTLPGPTFDTSAASNATVVLGTAQRVGIALVAKKRPTTATLGVSAFIDANGNGVRDAGEASVGSLAGQFVYTNYPSAAATNFTTYSDGQSSYTSLPAETVTVSLTLPTGYAFLSAATQTVTLTAGQTKTAAFALAYAPAYGIVTGRVYEDVNTNGTYDPGERLLNLVAYADLNDNGALDAGEPSGRTTGSPAMFQLVGVPPGSQKVRVVGTSNYAYPNNAAGRRVDVAAGQTTAGVDLGVVNVAPSPFAASILGATQVAEGQTVTLSGYGQRDAYTLINGFEWDLDYVPGTPFAVDKTGYTIAYGGDLASGPHVIAGRAYNDQGRRSDVTLFTIQVVNVAPTAAFAAGVAVGLGQASGVIFSNATDPSSADAAAGFRYSYDFNNDGDFTDAGDVADSSSPAAAYAYASPGTHTVRGRISDQDGGFTDYTAPVVVQPPAFLSAGPGAAYALAGGTLSVTAGTITLTADVADVVTTLNVTGNAAVVAAASQHLGAIAVQDQARFTLTPGGGKLLRVGTLAIGPAGTLDLNDNDLIVDSAGTPPQRDAVRALLAAGRNGGDWAGAGLISTRARNDPDRRTTLGYMEAGDYLSAFGASATFAGESLDSAAVLVRYTLYGDTDLDRRVTIGDFNRLAPGFGVTAGKTWQDGDSDNDGDVDIGDFNLMVTTFGLSLPAPIAG